MTSTAVSLTVPEQLGHSRDVQHNLMMWGIHHENRRSGKAILLSDCTREVEILSRFATKRLIGINLLPIFQDVSLWNPLNQDFVMRNP
jgi:hypothetical protein